MTMASNPGDKTSHDFQVKIEGITLTREAADRIARAVRQAVLNEVATLDLRVNVGMRFVGNGGTQGIELIAKGGPNG
jgi:hypothetical protein